jgi:hypothetical protein
MNISLNTPGSHEKVVVNTLWSPYQYEYNSLDIKEKRKSLLGISVWDSTRIKYKLMGFVVYF